MAESKLEELLKKEGASGGKVAPSGQTTTLKTSLEQELQADDDALAKDLQRTRAEEIIAARNVRISQLRAHTLNHVTEVSREREPGAVMTGGRGKEWLTDLAQGLLEKGMDPAIVGRIVDYLIGAGQFPMVGLPSGGAPAQGMSFADMREMFKMGQESVQNNGGGTDPEIKEYLKKIAEGQANAQTEAIKSLVEEVRKIKNGEGNGKPATKMVFLEAGAEAKKDEDGIVYVTKTKYVTAPAAPGTNIEELRENNRAAERKLELEESRKSREMWGETIAKTVESVAGVGASLVAGGVIAPKGAAAKAKDPIEYFKCTGCGFEIPVTPGAPQITCPQCKKIFFAEGSPLAKAAAAIPTASPAASPPEPEVAASLESQEAT